MFWENYTKEQIEIAKKLAEEYSEMCIEPDVGVTLSGFINMLTKSLSLLKSVPSIEQSNSFTRIPNERMTVRGPKWIARQQNNVTRLTKLLKGPVDTSNNIIYYTQNVYTHWDLRIAVNSPIPDVVLPDQVFMYMSATEFLICWEAMSLVLNSGEMLLDSEILTEETLKEFAEFLLPRYISLWTRAELAYGDVAVFTKYKADILCNADLLYKRITIGKDWKYNW